MKEEIITIPILNVKTQLLRKIIKWMESHKNAKIPCIGKDSGRTNSSKVSAFDYWEGKIFEMDQVLLYEVILTANFLDINFLLTAGCVVVAEMIKGKSPEDIRLTFNIVDGFIPEEVEALRR